jgi:DNA-binding LytR/AlgR family response regulator
VFTDVNMPGGMTGFELARQIRTRWPDKKIVLCTGYADEHADDSFDLLLKPYKADDLAWKLNAHLREETSRSILR